MYLCHLDPCAALICDNYAMCKASSDDETSCQCKESCANEPYPVCGSNRVTYRNFCSLKRDSCLKQEPISSNHFGSCSEYICVAVSCSYVLLREYAKWYIDLCVVCETCLQLVLLKIVDY